MLDSTTAELVSGWVRVQPVTCQWTGTQGHTGVDILSPWLVVHRAMRPAIYANWLLSPTSPLHVP